MASSRLSFIFLMSIHSFFIKEADSCYAFHKETQRTYLSRWKDLQVTIYDGDSVQEVIDKCPNGCDNKTCIFTKKIDINGVLTKVNVPCTSNDQTIALQIAQNILKGWQELHKTAQTDLIVHGSLFGVIFLLILVLIFRGHYRIRDLWFLPPDRQWEVERDPTWGLPGKVWSLLVFRVVKSMKKTPTQRKYLSYTENPTVMGNRFWYYKHSLRETYTKHKYYKRNRYFHKLAWQVLDLGRVIPETLRPHRDNKRLPAQVEVLNPSPTTPPENLARLPWEIDLADELNQVYLAEAKEMLAAEVHKEQVRGYFINGRFQPPKPKQMQQSLEPQRRGKEKSETEEVQMEELLTKAEVRFVAGKMEADPNEGFVNVEGVKRPIPDVKGKPVVRHHHHLLRHPRKEIELQLVQAIQAHQKELAQHEQQQHKSEPGENQAGAGHKSKVRHTLHQLHRAN